MEQRDILCNVVGVEKFLFPLLVLVVLGGAIGRSRKAHGRKIELAQFALPRKQTTSKNYSKRKFEVQRAQREFWIGWNK